MRGEERKGPSERVNERGMDGGWRQRGEGGREREGESSMLRGEGGNGGARNSSQHFLCANIYVS